MHRTCFEYLVCFSVAHILYLLKSCALHTIIIIQQTCYLNYYCKPRAAAATSAAAANDEVLKVIIIKLIII